MYCDTACTPSAAFVEDCWRAVHNRDLQIFFESLKRVKRKPHSKGVLGPWVETGIVKTKNKDIPTLLSERYGPGLRFIVMFIAHFRV